MGMSQRCHELVDATPAAAGAETAVVTAAAGVAVTCDGAVMRGASHASACRARAGSDQ